MYTGGGGGSTSLSTRLRAPVSTTSVVVINVDPSTSERRYCVVREMFKVCKDNGTAVAET